MGSVRADAWVPLAATQVCLLLTLSLAGSAWRTRRLPALSWAVALACATIGAGALWYGAAFGWSPLLFRLYYLGGALLAVPWLALGQTQVLVSRRPATVLAVLVFLASALGGAVVGLSELRGPVEGTGLPDGATLLPALPRTLVGVANGAGVLVLLSGLAVGVRRSWRGGPVGRSRATGLALVAAGAVVAGLGGTVSALGRTAGNALAVLVGLSLVYLGTRQAGRTVGRHRGLTAGPGRTAAAGGAS